MRILLATTALFAGTWSGPADAAAHDAKITAVFRTVDCNASPCKEGADPTISSGTVAGGVLQVDISAQADLGLEFVRLEAQTDPDPRYYCLELWDANRARTFTASRVWHTTNWTDPRKQCRPQDCSHCIETSPHQHGKPTDNVPHHLQVVAREQGASVSGSQDDKSADVTIDVQNPPSPPQWLSDPSSSEDQGKPVVSLRWAPNPETDVVEYLFVRTGPSGREAFAVNAAHPEDQGCNQISTAAIRCTDTAFGSGYGGTYRYQVLAVRRAFTGARCQFGGGRCVEGHANEAKTVTLNGPVAAPSLEPTGTGSSSAGPTTSANPTSGAPVSVTPPPSTVTDPLATGTHTSRAPWIGIGAGLLVLAGSWGAVAARRLVRRRSA